MLSRGAFYSNVRTKVSNCDNAYDVFTAFQIVNGNWGDWSVWTDCSATCDGKKRRTRSCNNPAPAHGGDDCPTTALNIRPCGVEYCPS